MGTRTEALLRPTENTSEFLLRDPLPQQAQQPRKGLALLRGGSFGL